VAARPSLFAPHVEHYLLVDEGEIIVDEVVKHPICMVWPFSMTLAGIGLMVLGAVFSSWWILLFFPGLALAVIGLWKYHERSMDRFVVTNMRVFRVNGVLNRHVATVPLTRILDISVYQPFFGMVFNYGHLTFESAAADQGMRRITFVGDPNRRDLTIQRVIQRAGIRAVAQPRHHDEGGT